MSWARLKRELEAIGVLAAAIGLTIVKAFAATVGVVSALRFLGVIA